MITSLYKASVLGIGFTVTMTVAMAKEHSALQYGVYDPEKRFAESGRIGVEHIFVAWQPLDTERLRSASKYAASRNRLLMVTVEPWPAHSRTGKTLFNDITAGFYDADIANVTHALGELSNPVFVRWGHEMEDVTGRYPWASHDAEGYIKAYRYFVDHCRPHSHGRFNFVWSPKGKNNMPAYYPGDKYVDYVGVSLYGLERWDLDHLGKPSDFNEYFEEIYSRASRYNKPVMIAELGVGGDAAYRHRWFTQVAVAPARFTRLRIVVYFNAKDPASWPDGYRNPDWRIEPDELVQGARS